VLMRVTEKQP